MPSGTSRQRQVRGRSDRRQDARSRRLSRDIDSLCEDKTVHTVGVDSDEELYNELVIETGRQTSSIRNNSSQLDSRSYDSRYSQSVYESRSYDSRGDSRCDRSDVDSLYSGSYYTQDYSQRRSVKRRDLGDISSSGSTYLDDETTQFDDQETCYEDETVTYKDENSAVRDEDNEMLDEETLPLNEDDSVSLGDDDTVSLGDDDSDFLDEESIRDDDDTATRVLDEETIHPDGSYSYCSSASSSTPASYYSGNSDAEVSDDGDEVYELRERRALRELREARERKASRARRVQVTEKRQARRNSSRRNSSRRNSSHSNRGRAKERQDDVSTTSHSRTTARVKNTSSRKIGNDTGMSPISETRESVEKGARARSQAESEGREEGEPVVKEGTKSASRGDDGSFKMGGNLDGSKSMSSDGKSLTGSDSLSAKKKHGRMRLKNFFKMKAKTPPFE